MVACKPSMLRSALRVLGSQTRAARTRERMRRRGLNVPPFMIFTVTSECNLHCLGCYSREVHNRGGKELDAGTIDRILKEAEEIGISVVLLSGGEPLIRPEVVHAAAARKGILFALFTNGTLLSGELLELVKRAGNMVPILSIEGFAPETDRRRGGGTFERVVSKMDELYRADLFFGCSITVTSDNFETVTSHDFIDQMHKRGCKLFIFVEYVPVQAGTEPLVLSEVSSKALRARVDDLKRKNDAIFISFPGDEERWGGCISSGTGFFHIGPTGDLEPCPFAPFSDRNIKDAGLAEALSSPLLAKVREARSELKETSGGCALWQRRGWLRSLM